jgi:hypothetical protein
MYEKLLFPDGMYRKEKARKELRKKGRMSLMGCTEEMCVKS